MKKLIIVTLLFTLVASCVSSELNSLPNKQNNYDESDRNYMLDDVMKEKFQVLFTELCGHFDFKTILEHNYDKNFADCSNPPDSKYQITAFDGDGIRRCMKLIFDENNFPQYKSYMQYKIIKSFHGFCTKELDDEFFDFYSRKLGGQEKHS